MRRLMGVWWFLHPLLLINNPLSLVRERSLFNRHHASKTSLSASKLVIIRMKKKELTSWQLRHQLLLFYWSVLVAHLLIIIKTCLKKPSSSRPYQLLFYLQNLIMDGEHNITYSAFATLIWLICDPSNMLSILLF